MGVNIGGKVNVKLFWPILFDYGKLHTDKLVIIGKNIYKLRGDRAHYKGQGRKQQEPKNTVPSPLLSPLTTAFN